MVAALLACAVCPEIGGVLLRGEKGTAKSTAARGLAALLPAHQAVSGCALGCDPQGELCPRCRERAAAGALPVEERRPAFVNLPLGATEDRVAGSLDLEQAIRHGARAFQPGLLARAHRGVLYVDEVNLLSDHLVDLVLDAASSGMFSLEREGLSIRHPARFTLIGTMNPEEGELRPQLLDRFGLCVEVAAPGDLGQRLEVLRRREAFEADPEEFSRAWGPAQAVLAARLERARALLPAVALADDLLRLCAELAQEACAAGHRAELAMERAARALAALDGRLAVSEEDVREAAELALAHRRRMGRPPEQEEPDEPEQNGQEPEEPEDSGQDQGQAEDQAAAPPPSGQDRQEPEPGDQDGEEAQPPPPGRPAEQVFAPDEPFQVRPIAFRQDRRPRLGSGRRSRSRTRSRSGSYVKSRQSEQPTDLALDATLRAAAPFQNRRSRAGVAVVIERRDLRQRIREKRMGHVVILAVDASGSMGAGRRMAAAKGAVLSLLLDAYQKRDKVGLVAFRGEGAQVLLPPTGSVERASVLLEELPTGGRTPLTHGLALSYELLDRELRRNPDALPLLVLISDGRANVSLHGGKPVAEALDLAADIGREGRLRCLVVDAEEGGLVRFGLARQLAERLGGQYSELNGLRAPSLVRAVREALA
jgi:magnesium chelatase subunit D